MILQPKLVAPARLNAGPGNPSSCSGGRRVDRQRHVDVRRHGACSGDSGDLRTGGIVQSGHAVCIFSIRGFSRSL